MSESHWSIFVLIVKIHIHSEHCHAPSEEVGNTAQEEK